MRQDQAAPRALRWAAAAAVALVFALLLAETQWLRPGYGVGDETSQVRLILAHWLGDPFRWQWAQGSLHRAALSLWVGAAGPGLGRLHLPGLLIFALELAALWALAKRWFGEEAAHWAVLVDLLAAASWLRARSVLTFQVLPLEILLFALLAGRVKGRWGALALGAAASLLSLEYEAGLVAGPFVFAVCAMREPGFRRQLAWAVGGLLIGLALILSTQREVLAAYVGVRGSVNLGGGSAGVLVSWARNLGQLIRGGEPMPYLGVGHWPAWAFWAWPGLGLGALLAWRQGARSLLLWALAVLLLTQASHSPYGVPAHRLAAAWPAFCLLGALGLRHMRLQLGASARWALPLLLLLGAATEASAFYRHMALHGRQVWGRSQLMAEAARDLGAACESEGAALCTGLMEARYADIRFHASSRALRSGAKAAAWVLLPPEFRQPAAGLRGQTRLWQRSPNDEPILALHVQGPEAERFIAMEAALRPLLDQVGRGMGQGSERDRAWLAAKPAPDLWSWSAVLQRDLRRAWEGKGLERAQLDLLITRAPISPGPDATVGRFLVRQDPASALRFLDRALVLDPAYTPALSDRAKALDELGRHAEAEAARRHWAESFRQGAWQIYD